MRKILTTLILSSLLFSLAACSKGIQGNGSIASAVRNLPTFQKVIVKGALNVQITTAKPQKVVVTTDSNLLAAIQTEIKNGTLIIQPIGDINPTETPVVTIRVKQLTSVNSEGAVKLAVTNLKTNDFAVHTEGASQVNLAGVVKTLQISSLGASQIEAVPLQASSATVSITGAAKVRMTAVKRLNIKITGAGSLEYAGNPVINQNVTGSGKILKIKN